MKIIIFFRLFKTIKTKEWLRNLCSTLKFCIEIWFILHQLQKLLKHHCRLFLNLVGILQVQLKDHHRLHLTLVGMVLNKVGHIVVSKECQDQDL